MSDRADGELVELAQRGDGAAIGELFSRYWRAARAAAFGVTGELASAEDAAAEAFREALAGMDSLRDPNRFGSWLRTIVVRKARRGLQSRRPAVEASANHLPDRHERPDNALERLELEALIQQAVRELPDRLREAMALVYFEGYDSDAAARFLDIPAGTLRRRLHDGRRQLRGIVEQVLQGNRQMIEERERQMRRLKAMFDDGEVYQAFRESLALRPPPSELIDLFLRRQMTPATGSQATRGGKAPRERVREMAERFLRASDRASDPNHPVGSIAAAIWRALPGFQEWQLNAGEAALRFLTFTAEHHDRLRAVFPPGFAEGHPGAFLRATRAIVRLAGSGRVRTICEHLRDSPDEQAFRAVGNDIRISDVLDMIWMVAGPLELRSVQEMLERLSFAVLPGAQIRFSTYDEPRYRSALQLHVGDVAARAALGGVLAEWPGRPQGADAAHLRIFLEPWATVRSGEAVEFEQLPERRPLGRA
jgi:RNA polymerase sigma factor (sigma-70 family)